MCWRSSTFMDRTSIEAISTIFRLYWYSDVNMILKHHTHTRQQQPVSHQRRSNEWVTTFLSVIHGKLPSVIYPAFPSSLKSRHQSYFWPVRHMCLCDRRRDYVEPFWILMKQESIREAVTSARPSANHLHLAADSQQSLVFKGWMLFLMPKQQCKSTEFSR